MSDESVLSQDEIDALLGSEGKVDEDDSDPAPEEDGGVRRYDLTSQDRVVHGRFPMLEVINEKFARYVRDDLFDLVESNVQVGAGGVQIMKYSEYVKQLYLPTAITVVKVEPLGRNGLLVVDARLLVRIVDYFFGGQGRAINIEGRDFTPTELKILDRVLEMAIRQMAVSWEGVLEISLRKTGFEENPSHLAVISQNDVVVVNTFQVDLESGGGVIHFVFPYTMIEKHRSEFGDSDQNRSAEVDPEWRARLREEILDTDVELRSVIASQEIALESALQLKPGEVLPLERPEEHLVFANGVPAFSAKLGNAGNNLAFEVTSLAHQDKES